MTEQDKNYVIYALEYALHKCNDVDGNAETHYNTLANAIEVVKNCSIPNVVGIEAELCDHEWTDARNKVIKSGYICLKCNEMKA